MADILVVGVDGSEGSRRAAEFAVARAKLTGGTRVRLVFVVEWSPYAIQTHEENEVRHRQREAEIKRARTGVLEPLAAALAGSGVELDTEVRHGHASRVLIDVSQEHGACQIVIGRLGRSSLVELLFGSTASNLVQAAPVPVTVVP